MAFSILLIEFWIPKNYKIIFFYDEIQINYNFLKAEYLFKI